MGWGRFTLNRFLDVIAPGAGVMLDILDAIELVQEGMDTGEIAQSAGEHLLDELNNDRRSGRSQVSADKIHRAVRRCGICRREGHNRRTCPQR